MKTKFYLPRQEALLILWLYNFKEKLVSQGASLGFSPSEISAVVNFYTAYKFMIETGELVTDFSKEWNNYKHLLTRGDASIPLGAFPAYPTPGTIPATVPAGGIKLVTDYVQRIRKHPNYNLSIAQSFGIIGAEVNIDTSSLTPKVSMVESISNHIKFTFSKKGMDGIIVYGVTYTQGQMPPQNFDLITGWQNIAKVNHSPYFDIRINQVRLPELRLYKFVYFLNDKVVGKESEIIRVMAEVYVDQDGNELSGKIK